VDEVISELRFQKEIMIKFLKRNNSSAESIDIAESQFDTAIHGVEEHLEHIKID
jgi:hypothetical protein